MNILDLLMGVVPRSTIKKKEIKPRVTPRQKQMLLLVSEGHNAVAAAARGAGVSASTAYNSMERLVRKGFLSAGDPNHRLCKKYYLTDDGMVEVEKNVTFPPEGHS